MSLLSEFFVLHFTVLRMKYSIHSHYLTLSPYDTITSLRSKLPQTVAIDQNYQLQQQLAKFFNLLRHHSQPCLAFFIVAVQDNSLGGVWPIFNQRCLYCISLLTNTIWSFILFLLRLLASLSLGAFSVPFFSFPFLWDGRGVLRALCQCNHNAGTMN